MELPVYELLISESAESGLQVDYVALVDKPAIQKNFMAFNEQKLKFALNEERRIISGPAMLADTIIYRSEGSGKPEHYVFFSANTIYQIVQKFFDKGFNKNFNDMHNSEQRFDGVSIFESFIVDSARGIVPMKGFEDAKDGSWFISAKVENNEAWDKVKSGEFKGFSVEGIFQYKEEEAAKTNEEMLLDQIIQILNK